MPRCQRLSNAMTMSLWRTHGFILEGGAHILSHHRSVYTPCLESPGTSIHLKPPSSPYCLINNEIKVQNICC